MVICNSNSPRTILDIINGENVGTVFHPLSNPLRGRKRWILSVPVKGELWLNQGALKSIMDRHSSLFSPGIIKVTGEFHSQDAVRLCDEDGVEVGRGLVNYTSQEIELVKGMPSRRFAEALGYMGPEEIVGRGNCCLLVDWHDDDDHHHHHHDHHDGLPHTSTAPASLHGMKGEREHGDHSGHQGHGVGSHGSARSLGKPPLPGHHHSFTNHLEGSSGSLHREA